MNAAGRGLATLLLLGGLIGTAAAFVLTLEKIALLKDPSYVPSCSINPVLSCGSVMRTPQAEVFGFPNPLLGLATFPVVAGVGASILSGGQPGRALWLALQVGVTAGMGFVAWLIGTGLYRIGALCPYCMAVWTVMIPLFWYVTLHTVTSGALGTKVAGSPLTRTARDYHAVVLTIAYLVVLGLIAQRFWPYWVSVVR